MKKFDFSKLRGSILLMLFMMCALIGFSQGTDDFQTLPTSNSYLTNTSTGGWVVVNSAVGAPTATPTSVGTCGRQHVIINGKTSAVGSITSPTITGGCGTLSFNFAHLYNETNGANFSVKLVNPEDNTVILYDTTVVIANADIVKGTIYNFVAEVNVAADFVLVISNNSPSSYNGGNKDRVAIGCIEWTAYTATPEPIVVSVPTFAPEAGTYTAAQNVTIACATEGAAIYYTLDGTTPTANSTLYENAIEITETTTINAIAFVGETASDMATATYTIEVTPVEPDEPTVLELDSIATLPYAYNFEDVDPYFMINNGEATNAWYIGQAQTFDNKKLYISSNNGTTNKYDITAASTVTAYRDVMIPATGAVLSFDYRVNGQTSTTDYLKVDLNGTEIARLVGENDWASFSYDISGEMAGEVRVQFTWVNNASAGNQFPAAIDNISVIETPCSQPINLTANVDSTTAVISWVAAEGQTAWNLQYKLADHSEWYTVPATDTTVTLNDLQGNSNYNMRVQAVCGENVSAWTNGTFAVACQSLEIVPTDVVIGTGTSSNNQFPFSGYYNHSYNQQLFTEAELSANGIIPGTVINSLAFNYSYATSTTRPVTMWLTTTETSSLSSAFISINGFTQVFSSDCQEFSDANDGWNTIVLDQPFTYTGGNLVLATLMNKETAPDATTCFTTYSGTSRFRYTSNSGKARYYQVDGTTSITFTEAGMPKTSGSALSGTSSSYRNNIKFNADVYQCADVVACVEPTNLEVSDITANSAVLTWTAAEGQANYIVEYMAEDATEWTSVEVSDTTYALNNLAQLTNYSVKVKTNCGTNNWSEVITASFRTAGICSPVTNLETANVSNTTTLTWEPGGEETAWLVQFKPATAGEDAWTSIDVSLIPMTTFGGLVGNTDYTVRVKALCDPENTENQSEWTSTSFHSGCASIDIPFVEDFTAATENLDCWTKDGFTYSYSNGYASSNTDGAWLITPAINIPAENTTYLTIKSHGYSGGDYTVLASYRGTREDRFAQIYTGTVTSTTEEVIIPIADLYKGRAVNFKIVNNGTTYKYIDEVTVTQCPFAITLPTTSNVTGTTFDVAWDAHELANNFQVQYGEAGFTLGEGTIVVVNDTTATTITGLNYSTEYDVYVRANCEDETIGWSEPAKVTTAPACSDIVNLEYEFIGTGVYLSWEAGPWGTPASYNIRYKSERDDEYTETSTTALFTTISDLYSNTMYEFGVQAVCSSEYSSEWYTINALTPCTNSCNLVFTVDDEYGDSWNGASVSVYQDGNLLATVTCEAGGDSGEETYTVAICKGSDINLVWNSGSFDSECSMTIEHNGVELYNGGAASGTFATFAACPNCSAPYALTANNITANSAEITWNDNNETGTYTLEYKTSEEESWTSVTGLTTTSYTMSGLVERSSYMVRVMTVCGYNDESTWTDAISFNTPCSNSCNLVFTVDDDYGDGWNGASVSVYQDGVLLNTITCEEAEETYTVAICKGSSISLSWTVGSYDSECSMTIEHNGVEIYNGGAPSGTFATFTACPTCIEPSNLAATTDGVITWTNNNTSSNFVVEYKIEGESEWTSANVTTNTYTIENLELSTTYLVRVKADCGDGDESGWTSEVSFTTPACVGGSSATITGTSASTSYLPSYSLYNYSLTQQIYLSSEMNMPQGASLTSMTFTVNTLKNRNVSIYLAHTTASEFTSSSAFLTLNDAVEVYSGPAFETTGEYVITFTQPFNYNGTDNLVLMVDDNTGSWSSGLNVAAHSATNMSMRVYSDGTNYNVNSVSSYTGTRMSYRNDVMFVACPPQPEPTCFVPATPAISEIGETSAVVTWTDNHNQGNYAVEYKAEGEANWTVANVDTAYYLMNNLTASTEYIVRVKAVCGTDDESDYTESIAFRTNCISGGEVEIAGTTGTDVNYMPVGNFYRNSYTQQIFKAEDINAAGMISSISFEYASASPTSAKNNVKIYLANTDKEEFTSTSDWVTEGLQEVYSGNLNCSEGWNEFALNTGFAYSGGNLLVVVEDNSNAYNGSAYYFKTTSRSTYTALTWQNDSQTFSNQTGTRRQMNNNVRFTICPEAIDLAVTGISSFADACDVEGAVTIAVKNLGYEGTVSTFEAYYQLNEETPVQETVTLNPALAMGETAEYTFNALPTFAEGLNTITAWVELTGDAVETNNSIVTEVAVLAPAAVPYEEAFTGLTINHGWNPIDANNDGITMNLNNDINYTFNDEAAADDWMMSPCIEMAAGTYTIIYDYKANSSLTEAFEVFYGNGAHVADMTNAVAAHSFNNTDYETATTTITIAADGIYNFGFHATSLAGNLGFSIDNFKVYPVNDVIVTCAANGTVTPNGTIAVNYGENLTLNLVPDPMYHVAGVWVDDVQVVPEDGTGANFMLYTLENVTEPHTVFVDFKLEFHIFKTVENFRPDLYSDLGGAFVPAATDTTIDPNAFTVNMVADPHYHMVGLTVSPMVPDMQLDVFADVVDNGDGTYSYTIDTLVVANYYLNAIFRRDTVAINYNVLTGKGYANDSELLNAGDTYTTWVDYSVNNDVDTTVSFTGHDLYHVADVTVNGTSMGHIESYTFENVTETQTVDIKFGYKIDASVRNYNTYGDIAMDDPQGTIEPATQYIPEFDPMTVTGTVAEHFHLYQFIVNGDNRIDEVVFGADNSYSFSIDSVAENYIIEAVVKVDTFAITYNVLAGQGYADESELLVAGDTYSTIVNYGDNWYSDIEAATGFSIGNVTLDGQNMYTASNNQFNNIVESHVFDITFVANTYTITTNAYGDGTVSDGISFTYDPANTVDYEFIATAAEGHHIASVVINNEEMEITDPEVYTDTIINVADNYVINVTFAVNTYTMNATASDGGNITPNGTQIVNYGSDVNYDVMANEGWYVAQVVIDGVVTNYTQADDIISMPISFTGIDSDHVVSVLFDQYMYTITGTVGANGTVNGETTINASLAYGSNYSLNIVPAANYHVADVVVDANSVGAVEFYEFVNITENHIVDVTFEPTMYTLTAISNTTGCTITPANTIVQAGSDVNYTLTVANGYHLVNVIANGQEVTVANNAFTISDVQSDYTIFANFAPDYVTVTVDQPAHATITPGTMTYAYGSTPSYMIVPEVGYDVVSVTAGNAVVAVTYNNGIGTFTLAALQQDITLTATTSIKKFEITVTQGANGTITPGTQTNVEYGSNKTFTITPNDYYVVADVIVDGSSRGALTSYTFYNVTGNHTITAVFEANCQTPTNLTAMDIDTTSAVLSWVGTAPSYEVRYKAADAASYTTQTVTTTSLQVTGLTPNTLYEYGVRAICGANLTSDWATNAFTTRALPLGPVDGIANAELSNVKVYSYQSNVYIVNEDGIAISNVDIYDIYGKQVYTGKVLSSPEVISLNVANGNYVVRLTTANGVGVYKVAIVR